jgi:hypothetical protein
VSTLASIAAIAVGFAAGGAAGYKAGRAVVLDRRRFWIWASLGVVVCIAIDLLGLALGQNWLELGALGAMAGWLTGIKYGGIAEVRVWDPSAAEQIEVQQPVAAPDARPDATVPASEDAGTEDESRAVTD